VTCELLVKQPAVYMLATGKRGTLYIGVTSDLVARTWQHREHIVEGFTRRYNVTMLAWYELHGTMESAILREKQLKKWNREWKLRLVQEFNPEWRDLWDDIVG
jgi:putative endonuclease